MRTSLFPSVVQVVVVQVVVVRVVGGVQAVDAGAVGRTLFLLPSAVTRRACSQVRRLADTTESTSSAPVMTLMMSLVTQMVSRRHCRACPGDPWVVKPISISWTSLSTAIESGGDVAGKEKPGVLRETPGQTLRLIEISRSDPC